MYIPTIEEDYMRTIGVIVEEMEWWYNEWHLF